MRLLKHPCVKLVHKSGYTNYPALALPNKLGGIPKYQTLIHVCIFEPVRPAVFLIQPLLAVR